MRWPAPNFGKHLEHTYHDAAQHAIRDLGTRPLRHLTALEFQGLYTWRVLRAFRIEMRKTAWTSVRRLEKDRNPGGFLSALAPRWRAPLFRGSDPEASGLGTPGRRLGIPGHRPSRSSACSVVVVGSRRRSFGAAGREDECGRTRWWWVWA